MGVDSDNREIRTLKFGVTVITEENDKLVVVKKSMPLLVGSGWPTLGQYDSQDRSCDIQYEIRR